MALTYTDLSASGDGEALGQVSRQVHKWNFDADGNGQAAKWPGGSYANFGPDASATYDSGTLKLQTSPDGETTWLDVGSSSTTAPGDGTKTAWLNACHVRPVLSGSTSPDLTCFLW